jgi:hypothetical protein
MHEMTGEPMASVEKDERTVRPTRTLAQRTASRKGHMMGEPVFGNLINAVRNVTLSRKRALQVIGGAMAVAVPTRLPQVAEAGKHRKLPLAFVAVAVTDVTALDAFGFQWHVSGSLVHPDSGFTKVITALIGTASNLTPDKQRAAIIANRRDTAVTDLESAGFPVPPDRIAVTLL